jgi:CHAT domain-containing protein
LAAKSCIGVRFLQTMVFILLLQPGLYLISNPLSQDARPFPAVLGDKGKEHLAAGQTHLFLLELSSREFIRIDFYSSNLDLVASIARPGSKNSIEWNISKREIGPISFIAEVRGTYQLSVRSAEKAESAGAYQMEIKAQRPAGTQSQKQVNACRRISHALYLRRQWTESSLKAAIEQYDQAGHMWRELGDQIQEAAALRNAGDLWRSLSESPKAMGCYGRAQAIYRQAGDRLGEIKTINAVSEMNGDIGEYRKSLDLYTLELMDIEDPWEKAHSLVNMGAAYYGMNEMPKATEFLNQGLDSYARLTDHAGQARALLYLGYINHAVKNVSDAEQYYQRSLEFARKVDNPKRIALAVLAKGHLANISGERQKALEYYDQSLKLFQPIGDLSAQCTILEGLAYLYSGLGEKQKALSHYFKALEIARRIKNLAAQGGILDYIGAIYADLGDYSNALKYSRQSIPLFRSMPSILGESYALANLGKILEALGRQKEAIDSYSRGIELSRRGGDQFLEGLLLSAMGHLHHGSGQLPKALSYYKHALALQQDANDIVRMPGTLHGLARAEQDAGNLDAAIKNARHGLAITELLRGKVASLELRGSYLASIHQQHELLIDLFMHLHRQRPNEQSDAMALQVSEQARARSMLDSLIEANTDIRQGADRELLERERSLQKLLQDKANQQMRLLRRKHSKAEETALSEEISAISEEYRNVQSQIKSTSPHYAALTQPQPLDLREIQKRVLDDETMLLEYALGENQSFLWAVTPTTIQSFVLPKRAEIESRAIHIRELLLARQSITRETAAQYQQRIEAADEEYRKEVLILSHILLGPASGILGTRRLLIVAEGALQYLPFAALRSPQSDNPLIADHEIVSLPSASLLAILRDEIRQRPTPPKTLAVFADPVFEVEDPRLAVKKSNVPQPPFPSASRGALVAAHSRKSLREIGTTIDGFTISRLPGSLEEAAAILASVHKEMAWEGTGFNANRSVALKMDLDQYRIVHFATHGMINDEHPDLSGLVLSLFDEQGNPQDGYLRMNDIYNMKLPVDLVVLSACNSGLGKEMRGEGLVGMVRGFMYAGAARVVSSLWKVEDEATAALMKRFYQRMLQDNHSPAQALRMAQLDMLQQKRWQSPYYWAAFVLQGEWK